MLTGARRLPPFALRKGNCSPLRTLPSRIPHSQRLPTSVQLSTISLKEICQYPATETIAAELLKKALESRMIQCGMRVDRRRNRAYYRCDRQNARSIEYTTMAGRRTKRRVSRWPQKLNVGYCEHEAVSYRVIQYGESWVLMLQPTYIVTLDGVSNQLPPNRTR